MQIGSSSITETEFEALFKAHFRELHAYAYSLVNDWDNAEELVQNLFLKLWERNDWAAIHTSVKSYLYKSVYHESLNLIRREKVHLRYQTLTKPAMENNTGDAAENLKLREVEKHLANALNKLPEKCRAVFHLSRFEELKYQQIADQLNISIKTVETHMVKALKILRKEMAEFLPAMVLLLLNLLKK
ncbi:RNA polymerase sigma-70 factor [Mucilaginibacter sp. dw_454]|uniref:RNA polymerase sigma-70 factor n=1 Tax=Mucilaginibacter sp. dw_454 TaxID=2720079 RepID=UPI001BD59BA3|nr:RNA polymerase sigma-70 factor [Mucilaginibacter sp. dw_454]